MYKNGGVTEKTDKQANRLVKKRKINKRKLKNLEDRKKEGKKTILGNVRTKLRKKREKNIQEKINANPTAQKWKKDGEKKKKGVSPIGRRQSIKKAKKKTFPTDGAQEYKTGGFNTGAGSWIESTSVSSID